MFYQLNNFSILLPSINTAKFQNSYELIEKIKNKENIKLEQNNLIYNTGGGNC